VQLTGRYAIQLSDSGLFYWHTKSDSYINPKNAVDCRHMHRKTFTNRNLMVDEIRQFSMKTYRFIKKQKSYKGGSSKAFSAHMPVSSYFINAFFGLI